MGVGVGPAIVGAGAAACSIRVCVSLTTSSPARGVAAGVGADAELNLAAALTGTRRELRNPVRLGGCGPRAFRLCRHPDRARASCTVDGGAGRH